MTPVPDRTERTQEQQGRRGDPRRDDPRRRDPRRGDPHLGEARTPPEPSIDTHRLAETLSEDDLTRALERSLAKAGAQWNLSL